MKRFIAIILSLIIFSAFFCGCKSTDTNSTSSDIVSSGEDLAKSTTILTSSKESEPTENTSEEIKTKKKTISSKPINEKSTIEKLSLEKINQIKKDYWQSKKIWVKDKWEFNPEEFAFEHYATLSDGSMIIHINTNHVETDRMETEIIGEYYCTFNYAKRLQVYKNHKFEYFRYAYESGLISKAVLDEFFKKCPQFCSGKVEPNKQNPPVIQEPEKVENYGNLDIKIVEKIKAKYLETTSIAKLQKLIITAYYGTFSDGSIAIRFDVTGRINSTENIYKHIGKYWCKYESKLPVMVYKNNGLYKLHDAYKEGVISDKILNELFAKNPNLNGTKYYESRLIARRKQLQDWLKSPTVKETRSYWKGSANGDFVEGEI